MRGRRLSRRSGAPSLDDDNRLAEGDFTRSRQERASIAYRFHVDDDAVRLRVIAEVINQVAPADIKHGANRDESAEADVFLKAPVENRCAERAALADEA